MTKRPSYAHLQVEMFTELIGTMLFALLGGVADPNGTGRDGCGQASGLCSACTYTTHSPRVSCASQLASLG